MDAQAPVAATLPAATATPATIPQTTSMSVASPDASALATLPQLLTGLVLVVALILLVAWLFRRMGVPGTGSGAAPMRVVQSIAVGTRERVVMIEVGDQWVMVGVAPGAVRALHHLPRSQADSVTPESISPPTTPGGFAATLQQSLERLRGTPR